MKPAFDIKTSRLDVLSIHLHTADLTELEEFLRQLAGQSKTEFVPFILDVQDFDHPESIDLGGMISLFARYGMQILGLHHTSDTWAGGGGGYHLVFKQGSSPKQPTHRQRLPAPSTAAARDVQTTVINNPTVLVSTPVRTGQQVYAEKRRPHRYRHRQPRCGAYRRQQHPYLRPMRGRALAGAKGKHQRAHLYSFHAGRISLRCRHLPQLRARPAEHLHKTRTSIIARQPTGYQRNRRRINIST